MAEQAQQIDYNQMTDKQIREELGVSCFGAFWDSTDQRCQVECPIEARCATTIVSRRIPQILQMHGGEPMPDQVLAGELSMTPDNLVTLRRRVQTGQPLVPPEPELPEAEEEAAADAEMEDYMAKKQKTEAAAAETEPTKVEPAQTKNRTTKKAHQAKKAAAAEPERSSATAPNGKSGPAIGTAAGLSDPIRQICDVLAEEFGLVFKAGTTDQQVLDALPKMIRQIKQATHGVEAAVADTNDELARENMLLRKLLSGARLDPDLTVELKATEVLSLLRSGL